MRSILRWRGIARLVAGALSLALSVALFAASVTHAAQHHHGFGAPAAQEGHAGHEEHMTADGDADLHHSHAVAHGALPEGAYEGEPCTGLTHQQCMDFMCHGSMAMIEGGQAGLALMWPAARVSWWHSRRLHPVDPAGLDRPPKSFVPA